MAVRVAGLALRSRCRIVRGLGAGTLQALQLKKKRGPGERATAPEPVAEIRKVDSDNEYSTRKPPH